MKIILTLVIAYLFIDMFKNTVYIDIYSDLKQASPYEHCVAAFSGTSKHTKCQVLRLEGE